MQIANPIYDVVFKYLMEDSKVAKLLISSIIKQEVELLEFRPQEYTTELGSSVAKNKKISKEEKTENLSFFTIYRLDFSAKIKTPEGEKIVLIELQKAKFATDIMRFRKYLGDQYSDKANIYITEKDGKRIKQACEIISIYFLGHELENIHGVPVIKSKKTYIDVSTGEEIKAKEYFIDSLNHESYTIPIPELKSKRRNELEKLLSIFDQSNRAESDHILNVTEEDFPEAHRPLIRRLQRAASQPEIRKKMDLEDEILEEFGERDRQLAMKDLLLNEQTKVIETQGKAIEEERRQKEEAQRKQEEERRQKEEERRQKEEALLNSVRGFLEFGATKEQIAKKLNLPLKEVERLIYELGEG